MSFWPTVKKVIREAEIVLLVLDARMPILSMNREVKDKIEMYNKRMLLIFNKIDLISKEQLENLKKDSPEAFFVSSSKNIGISNIRRKLIFIEKKSNVEVMKIGVVGYPNVGKSSLINALTKRSSTNVSSAAGTTKGIQWIKNKRLKFLDSPGVIPYEDGNSKLGILGAKNPQKLKSPYKTAYEVIGMFLEKNKKAFEDHYNLKFSNDTEEIFEAIGKRRGFLSKGGSVDKMKTSISIILDWQKGKIKV